MEQANGVTLRFQDKVYIIPPDFNLVREIEHELGGSARLLERFMQQEWTVSELVALTHMMLGAAGETVDYLALGNQMLKEGLSRYLASAQGFLRIVLQAE